MSRNSGPSVCAVEGCSSKVAVRGLCNKHYIRMRLHGSTVPLEPWRDWTDAERFWSKVSIAGPDDCWLWVGSEVNSKGYGRFVTYKPKRRRFLAHRYAYQLAHGVLEDETKLMHSCDMPLCCNPAHLKTGTQLDNMRDCLAKGRMNMTGLALGWGRKERRVKR